MEPIEIAKFLRVIAEVIETNPKVAKAIKEQLDKKTGLPEVQSLVELTDKKSNHGSTINTTKLNKEANGQVLLSKSREILRGQGEAQLKEFLTEQGENVREILKYGQLDPQRTVRRRKKLGSIVDHIIKELVAQDMSGTLLAQSITGFK